MGNAIRRAGRYVALAALIGWSPGLLAGVPEVLNLDTQDGARTALLALPDHAGAAPLPLVILLHGRGGSAASSISFQRSLAAPLSAWLPIGERDKVAIVALQGMRGTNALAGWNDCRSDDPSRSSADDVGYARAVIDQVRQKHAIDMSRVYLMGMSNGAMLAYRLVAELGLPIAALAAVAGPLPANSSCPAASSPLSVLLISGTLDPMVPYQGGEVHFGSAESGSVLSVDDTVSYWRTLDGLADTPAVERFPVRPDSDGKTTATRLVWGSDPAALQVELVRIDAGGHTEPSIDQVYGRIYLGLAGAQNHDLESAEEAWRFFRDKRSLPTAAPAH